MTCCSHIAEATGAFSQVVALEWYDGLTEGVTQCRTCGTPYRIHMLAWDEQQDVRIYSLTPLLASLPEVISVLRPLGEPRWPAWLPTWANLPEQQWNSLQLELDRALTPSGAVAMMIATEDLTTHIGRLRCLRGYVDTQRFEALSRERAGFEQWLAFLSESDVV